MQFSDKKFLLTKEGLAHIKGEYEELVETKRPRVIARIQQAREFGDLTENSEYDAAKEEQSLVEARISELEGILGRAELISYAHVSNDFVVIGSTVVVEVDGQRDEFKVVGTVEADPVRKKISSESPVGAALLGAKVGEIIDVVTPIVRAKYIVLEIK